MSIMLKLEEHEYMFHILNNDKVILTNHKKVVTDFINNDVDANNYKVLNIDCKYILDTYVDVNVNKVREVTTNCGDYVKTDDSSFTLSNVDIIDNNIVVNFGSREAPDFEDIDLEINEESKHVLFIDNMCLSIFKFKHNIEMEKENIVK